MTFERKETRSAERVEFARSQRRTANEFAQDVWQLLRGGRILGAKFRREYPFGPYTLDFVCLSLKLNIEIDGKEHLSPEGQHRDRVRDAYLSAQGFEVLRILGYRVIRDIHEVRREIESVVKRLMALNGPLPDACNASARTSNPSPPTPLPEAGRGEEEQRESG